MKLIHPGMLWETLHPYPRLKFYVIVKIVYFLFFWIKQNFLFAKENPTYLALAFKCIKSILM